VLDAGLTVFTYTISSLICMKPRPITDVSKTVREVVEVVALVVSHVLASELTV
jgi:hypothetical protein